MARARGIKPSIMDNEELAELKPLTRLLFIYLWMLADREGRLEDRPKRIAAQALAYDRTADIDSMLSELEKSQFIHRYAIGGFACIQITCFTKHQMPHGTEKDSELPDDQGFITTHKRSHNGYATGEKQLTNCVLTVKQLSDNTLTPDSCLLTPDSCLLTPDSNIETPQDKPAQPKVKRVSSKTRIPDDFQPNDTGVTKAIAAGFSVAKELEKFRNHHESKGTTMASWQAGWRTWIDKAITFAPKQTATGETAYQRSMREKFNEASGRNTPPPGHTIDVTPTFLEIA